MNSTACLNAAIVSFNKGHSGIISEIGACKSFLPVGCRVRTSGSNSTTAASFAVFPVFAAVFDLGSLDTLLLKMSSIKRDEI
jgi:hypothetical protein